MKDFENWTSILSRILINIVDNNLNSSFIQELLDSAFSLIFVQRPLRSGSLSVMQSPAACVHGHLPKSPKCYFVQTFIALHCAASGRIY